MPRMGENSTAPGASFLPGLEENGISPPQKISPERAIETSALRPPDLGLTLFAHGCYSRRVPIGRGFSVTVRQLGLSKLIRQGGPTTTKRLIQQSASSARSRLSERHNLVRRYHRPSFRF